MASWFSRPLGSLFLGGVFVCMVFGGVGFFFFFFLNNAKGVPLLEPP